MREERRVRRDEGREINREDHSIFIDKVGAGEKVSIKKIDFMCRSLFSLITKYISLSPYLIVSFSIYFCLVW